MTMLFGRARTKRAAVAVLLASVLLLLGLSAVAHTHEDGRFDPSHCEVCRWTSDATPTVAVVLLLVLTLCPSGTAWVPAPALRSQPSRRRTRSRAPPLV